MRLMPAFFFVLLLSSFFLVATSFTTNGVFLIEPSLSGDKYASLVPVTELWIQTFSTGSQSFKSILGSTNWKWQFQCNCPDSSDLWRISIDHWDRARAQDEEYQYIVANFSSYGPSVVKELMNTEIIMPQSDETGWYPFVGTGKCDGFKVAYKIPEYPPAGQETLSPLFRAAIPFQGSRGACRFMKQQGNPEKKFILCDSFLALSSNVTNNNSNYPLTASPEFEIRSIKLLLPTANSAETCYPPQPEEIEVSYYDGGNPPSWPTVMIGLKEGVDVNRSKISLQWRCLRANLAPTAPMSSCAKHSITDEQRYSVVQYYVLASGPNNACPCIMIRTKTKKDATTNKQTVSIGLMRLSPVVTDASAPSIKAALEASTDEAWLYLPGLDGEIDIHVPDEPVCPGYSCTPGNLYCPCVGENLVCDGDLNCEPKFKICIDEDVSDIKEGSQCTAEDEEICKKRCPPPAFVAFCGCAPDTAPQTNCGFNEEDSTDYEFIFGLVGGFLALILAAVVVIYLSVYVRKKQALLEEERAKVDAEMKRIEQKVAEEEAKPLKPNKRKKKDAAATSIIAANKAYQVAASQMTFYNASGYQFETFGMAGDRGSFYAGNNEYLGNMRASSEYEDQFQSIAISRVGQDHICPGCGENYATQSDLDLHRAKRGHLV